MKEKTTMQKAIQLLEQQRTALKEMDLLGVLLENEFAHKSNQINTIQLMLSRLIADEKKQMEDAFYNGIACTNSYSDVWELINGGDFRSDFKDYSSKFKD